MTKPIKTSDIFWKAAYYLCIVIAGIVMLLVATAMMAHGETTQLQRRTGPPQPIASCQHRLDQVRFREWTAANAEGLLHVRAGEHEDAVYYYRQAQRILDDKNLNPSPAHCTQKWLTSSEVQADTLELDYHQDVEYYKSIERIK